MSIMASLDLRLTLGILLDQVALQLGVDAASVLIHNATAHRLEYAATRGFHDNARVGTVVRVGEGHAGRAALEQRQIHVPDMRHDGKSDEGFVAYFAVPLMAKGEVKGVLELYHREALHPEQDWLEFLDALAGQAAIAIENGTLFERLERSNLELNLAYDTTIEGWPRALDLRDQETEGHSRRVTDVTLALAENMRVDEAELVHIRRGALLHDIGKMGIPDSILLKPGPLTADEWVVMRKHPTYAHALLSPIDYLRAALDIPYCHHEKWDGTGYPRGLRGEDIPLAARIFAIADVWGAFRSDRPYRRGWASERVQEHIRAQTDLHFDPRVVAAFFGLIDVGHPCFRSTRSL